MFKINPDDKAAEDIAAVLLKNAVEPAFAFIAAAGPLYGKAFAWNALKDDKALVVAYYLIDDEPGWHHTFSHSVVETSTDLTAWLERDQGDLVTNMLQTANIRGIAVARDISRYMNPHDTHEFVIFRTEYRRDPGNAKSEFTTVVKRTDNDPRIYSEYFMALGAIPDLKMAEKPIDISFYAPATFTIMPI